MLLNGSYQQACLLRYTPRSRNVLSFARFKLKNSKRIYFLSRIYCTTELKENFENHIEGNRNHGNIFKDSEFHLLKVSEHGSLVPIEDEDTLFASNELAYSHEEEELKHTKMNSNLTNALLKNPNETTLMRRLRRNKVKMDSLTIDVEWNRFIRDIIGNERTVKDYNFELPKFPKRLETGSLKQYLQDINAISFEFDTKGRQQLVFYQMKDLLDNLYKLEGLLDIEILHEFVKFFGNFTDPLRIIKVLKKFELLGILPNKDTLDLMIYKLGMIPNGQRQYWLQLYLQLGTFELNVKTDLRTRALVCMLENSSKERRAMLKAVINEGFPYDAVKWHYIEDIISLNVSQTKFDFNLIFSKLVKNKLAYISDKLKAFEIYIKLLAYEQHSILSINQILVNPELETSDCWATFIEALILHDKIWEAYAVFNYARSRRVDVHKIVVLFLKYRKRVYQVFYKLQDFEKQEIFLEVEKYLISLCDNDLKCCEKIMMDYETIRIDTKDMSNFIEKHINEMNKPALLKELAHKKSFDLKINKTELPWR